MKGIMFNEHFGLESAVLSGRKTQTRRIIKQTDLIARHWNPELNPRHCYYKDERGMCQIIDEETRKVLKPRYSIGEVVAIKQSYSTILENISKNESIEKANYFSKIANSYDHKGDDLFVYNCEEKIKGWHNKMYVKNDLMVKHIKITNIKIERLQNISDDDCLKEGVIQTQIGYYADGVKCKDWNKEHHVDTEDGLTFKLFSTPQKAFASLIDKVSGKGTWESNPFVWVYDFELQTKTE